MRKEKIADGIVLINCEQGNDDEDEEFHFLAFAVATLRWTNQAI